MASDGPTSNSVVHKENESRWVFGAVANNIWSFGGPPGSSDRTNQLLLNPFDSYHFAEGWSAKVVRLGEQPIKLDLDAYYNAIRPKAGNETWLVQVAVTWQFPD